MGAASFSDVLCAFAVDNLAIDGMPVELFGAGEHREVGRGECLRRHDCLSLKVTPTAGARVTPDSRM
jgi:hypothetical protein